MTDDLEERIAAALRAMPAPAAPHRLRDALQELPASGGGQPRSLRGIAAGVVVATCAIGVLALLPGSPLSIVSPQEVAPAGGSSADLANGIDALTVSAALDLRESEELGTKQVRIHGYWTDRSFGHSCTAPDMTPGELELRCHDGEFGITELPEPILAVTREGRAVPANGPALTPWVPEVLAQRLFGLPFINGQLFPPTPIVVAGHFNDPRAQQCQPDARLMCQDRLVLDEIIAFDLESIPSPGPTASPTPFPLADPPPGIFGKDSCEGDTEYSFIGWTTMSELGIDVRGDGHVWVMITKAAIPLTDWMDDPANSKHQFRIWGQRVCYAWEWDKEALGLASLPGSTFRVWDDGRREPVESP
jgi:hypothetical protein